MSGISNEAQRIAGGIVSTEGDNKALDLGALREKISDYLLTHIGGDETEPWQAGHNYAMREAARLIRDGYDSL